MSVASDSFAKQTLFYSLLALLAAFAWFLIGLPAWQTFHTDIAFQSFLAFSAIACIAVASLSYKERQSPFLIMIQGAMFFAAALHLGLAIDMLYTLENPIVTRSTSNLFNDLIELILFSSLLLLSIYSSERLKAASRRQLISISYFIGAIFLLLYGAFSGRFILIISESMMPTLSFLFFGVVMVILGITINLAYREVKDNPSYQSVSLVVSCILLAVDSLTLLIPILLPSLVWTFSVTLHSIAFFVLYLSLTVPYLSDVGMKPRNAAIFASGFSILFIAPFFVTLIVEGLIPRFYNPDLGAYTIIHLGAASLSAVMALLTYGHAKTKGQKNLYPLILLFASWTVVDLSQVILSRLPLPYTTESLVPYITGSLVSLIMLYFATQWTMNRPPANLPRPEFWPFIGLIVQTCLVIVSEVIEYILTGTIPVLLESPLGRSVLLTINLFAMFEFTFLIVYLLRKSGSGLKVDVLLTGFLSLWILPNIMKANFLDWTAGWYSAELLLLVALLFGPGVMGILYLREMQRAEIAHQRARVYSDLLVHDISNYHQAILISLGILDVEGIQPTLRNQMVRDAQSELQRADNLIRNVRQIGMSEEINLQGLEALDLVQCIRNSYEHTIPTLHLQSIEFSINRNLGECYVRANQLIEGIFSNLIRNAIQYSPDKKRVEIELELIENENGSFWRTKIIDYGQGIEPKKKAGLFSRFMIGAKGTGLGLSVAKTLTEVFGGKISMEDRIPGDYSKGSVFIVTLPKA